MAQQCINCFAPTIFLFHTLMQILRLLFAFFLIQKCLSNPFFYSFHPIILQAYAKIIISQYGGPDGELGASLRYLSQRYSMPYPELKGLLTDIGTEELGHLEMVGTIVHQLTRNLTEQQIKDAGFEAYFVDHTTGVFPQFASGYPWSAATMQVTGDTIADLTEDLAAEQKARVTYDNILRLSDDPDVNDAIKFLREREVVHFQRFGEALRLAKERMNSKNVYYLNPSFDTPSK